MTTDYRIFCLSESMSPITQMSGSVGNEQIINREPVVTPRGQVWVPVLSGNALRHRCLREPGAQYLVNAWGLAGKLTLDQLNFLMHGGNLTESTAHENTRRIAVWNDLFPLGKCLGGCLPNQILKGSLMAGRGMLVCEENRQSITRLLPAGFSLDERRLQSAEMMREDYQYTRGDSGKTGLTAMNHDEVPSKSSLMIFAGQAVSRGSLWLHDFQIHHATPLMLGAVLHALTLWQSEGGTIGGQSSRGHGRLKTAVHVEGCNTPAADLIAAYEEHVETHEEACVSWIHEQFKPVMDKAAKPTKGKKKAMAAVALPGTEGTE